MWKATLLAAVLLLLPMGAFANEKNEKEDREARLKALEERVRQLEDVIQQMRAELGGQNSAPALYPAVARLPAPPPGTMNPAATEVASAAPAQLPTASQMQGTIGGAPGLAKVLNPDISLIGDFLGAIGSNDIRPVPSLELHEAEMGLQAIIDPFARGDVFLAFNPGGVEIEEAYVTFTSVPHGFIPRIGKMRAEFGKVNTIHNHALQWTDRPLVTDNLAGGEEGISDAGISINRILPAPGDWFLDATAQVFQGNSEDLFVAPRREDVTFVGHLRGYRDITESTNLDLGFSFARGHNSEDNPTFTTQLYGVDATFRWKPLRRAIYHSLLARAEFVWSRHQQLDDLLFPETQRAFGLYASAEYRLNRRWTLGGRFDRSGRAAAADRTDTGFSALLTYWPSEFSQIRGQYRFTRYAEGIDANELRFQVLFVLGAHGAHPF